MDAEEIICAFAFGTVSMARPETAQDYRRIQANINRLLRLAQFLRDEVGKDFHMGAWAEMKKGDGLCSVSAKSAAHCKMVCCLGGWATKFHPDLVLREGTLFNTQTRVFSVHAFAEAFNLYYDVACDLTDIYAPHQTPKAAAKAIEKVAKQMADEHGYEIVEL